MQVRQVGPVAPVLYHDAPHNPTFDLTQPLAVDQSWAVEKLVAICTDRDAADPLAAAQAKVAALAGEGYAGLHAQARAALAAFWAVGDVVIEGDNAAQQGVRHGLYQLRIAAAQDERVSIAAKSLSGFGYRGHAFWDTETFILPYFTLTQPALARNLLMYRWHTLAGARKKAHENGFAGAQFAWESAERGEEVTPRWVPGPKGEELIRIWCGDIELHITADIAYAIMHYWRVTGDDAFMVEAGAPIILETARFWASRAEPDTPAPGQYSISDVIGPDEYHEHVDNNAFTNAMAAWHLRTALELVAWLRQHAPAQAAQLDAALDLTPARLEHWREIAANLVLLRDAQSGLIEQFAGFFQRKEVDWPAYANRTKSMQTLLGIEGANAHQVLKQPDVLLLHALLPGHFSEAELRTNWDYYCPRTDHTYGSSLGPAVHAWLACRLGKVEEAYPHFMRAALVDIEDVRGNTAEGIHAASAGGVWQALVFGFAGVQVSEDGAVTVKPQLPAHWRRLAFTLQVRGISHAIDLRQPELLPATT
jgi:kojibiose phosphorylase